MDTKTLASKLEGKVIEQVFVYEYMGKSCIDGIDFTDGSRLEVDGLGDTVIISLMAIRNDNQP